MNSDQPTHFAFTGKTKLKSPCVLAPMARYDYHDARTLPHPFKADGNFNSLREQGKLSDPRTGPGEGARQVQQEKKHFMPGYTGFVRGGQHIAGRTYGEMTRRAYDTQFEETVRKSPIPSAPNANRKIMHRVLPGTFLSTRTRRNHIPGYTGHVPGARATFSKTFGETTLQEMNAFSTTHPRPSPIEKEGFAYTTHPRALQHIGSAPIPGTAASYHSRPQMMIPGALRDVQFFSQ